MTPRARHLLLTALAGLLIALYIGLLHHFTARGTPSLIGAALALLPLTGTTLWIAWQSRRRVIALTLWFCAVGALAAFRGPLASNFAYVELIQHAGTFATLTALFARTLSAGRTPMVTRFARTVHGELPPRLARYTRGVTVAWTLVFATLASVSLGLFASGRIAAFSLLANVLTPAIVTTVFLAEYLLRRLTLPRELQTGFIDSIRSAWPAFNRWAARQEALRPTTPASERQP